MSDEQTRPSLAEEQLELKQENVWNAFQSDGRDLPLISRRIRHGSRISVPGDLVDKQRDTMITIQPNNEWVAFKILTEQPSGKDNPTS